MKQSESPTVGIAARLAVVLAGAALLIGLCVWKSSENDAPAVSERMISRKSPPRMSTCAACHPGQVATFRKAPHMRTLVRGNDPGAVSLFAGREFVAESGKPALGFVERDGWLWAKSARYPDPLRIDWMFGSGQHARTPVSVWENVDRQTELLQINVSWYPHVGLGPTLGINADRLLSDGIEAIAHVQSPAETEQCFACHSTYLPKRGGQIVFDELEPAVGCVRCHHGANEHAASNGENVAIMQRRSQMSPLASVNRCGECHRRADQLTAEELVPQNGQLIRFASVGLVLSRCFLGQEALGKRRGETVRLDCLTCHDPHRPAQADPEFYDAKCRKCHGTHREDAPACESQPITSSCTSCHLPKVEVREGLRFSDHWIRIRGEDG